MTEATKVTGVPGVDADLTPAARKILDAAAGLFYDRGITAVGVDLIARQAGVTKKTLYDRYGSKEALVTAYLRQRDELWRAWLPVEVDRIAGKGAPPQDRILATFDALGVWMSRMNPRGCAFVNAAAELPDPVHPGRQAVIEQKRWMRGYLRELSEAAGAPDPELLADELLLLYEGTSVLNGVGVVPDVLAVTRQLVETALERAGCAPGR